MYALIMTFILLLSYIISKQKIEYRKLLIIINSFVCIIYIIWRIFTIPIKSGIISFILGVTLFGAELLGLIAFFNFKIFIYKKIQIRT